ncbi:MAG: hypothetical protein O2816_08435 [Planctomycetota bacterium]|nr:hypothetical protein [Planctomycetota bacterium]
MTDASTAAPPTRLERCPNCNAKLPDTPVSICPYCVYPLGTEKQKVSEGGESPNHGRIQRILAHEDYPKTEGIQPPENLEFQQGGQAIFRGKVLLSVAVISVALGGILGGAALLTHWATWLGSLLAVAGALLIVKGGAIRKQSTSLPLLRRAGLILDRRSDTQIRGWGGSTTYYFEIEFEDGTRAEFRYPGRGSKEDPYVTNLPGVAFTRGQDLLIFKHIRV